MKFLAHFRRLVLFDTSHYGGDDTENRKLSEIILKVNSINVKEKYAILIWLDLCSADSCLLCHSRLLRYS